MTRIRAGLRSMLAVILGMALVPSLYSYTSDGKIDIHDSIAEDGRYLDAYEQASRSADVYVDFESRFHVTATYLSDEFRNAFSGRLKALMANDHPSFEEAGGKSGFFLSVQSPDEDSIDLENSQLWTIFLTSGGDKSAPVLVRRLRDKKRWEPFFPKVTKWSHEYLLVFERQPSHGTSQETVEKQGLKLTMSSYTAKVRLDW